MDAFMVSFLFLFGLKWASSSFNDSSLISNYGIIRQNWTHSPMFMALGHASSANACKANCLFIF
jgi:hypothetical protein